MSFVPISIEKYAQMHVKANPGTNLKEYTKTLREFLARYKKGAKCGCGAPIWVIGSSVLGNTCFTCATLEAYPSEDYEIKEACDKPLTRGRRPDFVDAGSYADDDRDDVPF